MIKRITSYALLLPITMSSIFVVNTNTNINNNANTKTVEITKEVSLPNGGIIFSDEITNKVNEYMAQKEEEARLAEIARLEEEARVKAEQERIEEERIRLESLTPNFNPYNVLEPSNLTREQVYKMLEGTALQTLSNAYVYMEELYGVNCLFLIGISAQESGWGRSSLAITHNNLGGIKTSDGSWRYFSDWGECLDYKARLLKNQYLSKDGDYFNGYSVWDVNIQYCEQLDWADKVSQIAYQLLSNLKG